jgi:hypothetical protein
MFTCSQRRHTNSDLTMREQVANRFCTTLQDISTDEMFFAKTQLPKSLFEASGLPGIVQFFIIDHTCRITEPGLTCLLANQNCRVAILKLSTSCQSVGSL